MNMLDYLDWRGDLTFQERELNEVDNLIFSTLAYLEMENWIPADDCAALTLRELCDICEAGGCDTSQTPCDPMRLLRKTAGTSRFREVQVRWYENRFDTEEHLQFAAVTFLHQEGEAYAAFRGTDNTLTGWREDCNFSYLLQTPGQSAAADYLNRIAGLTDRQLVVGGHSKGGNFAVYASAFCEESVRENRIRRIYSNDGPGFNSAIVDSPNYRSVLPIVEKIIPESSLVGILLSSEANRSVITSSEKGISQHNPYSWNVLGDHFVRADSRTVSSILLDSTLSSWIASLSAQDKQLVIDFFFDAMEASGAETVRDISEQKAQTSRAIARAILQIEPEKRSELASTFGKLFSAGKDTIMTELRKWNRKGTV